MGYLNTTFSHEGGSSPSVACNGSGCVHSSACPMSCLPHYSTPARSTSAHHRPPAPYIDGDISPTSKVTPPCIFFRKNCCSQGDKCRFSHTVSDSDSLSPSASLYCKFFRQGLCRKGEDCPFIHETSNEIQVTDSEVIACRSSSVEFPTHHETVEASSLSDEPGFSTSNEIQVTDSEVIACPSSGVDSPTHHETVEASSLSDEPGFSTSNGIQVTDSEVIACPSSGVESSTHRVPDCSSPAVQVSQVSAVAATFEPCTFHATGHCVRGDSCIVRHDSAVRPMYSPIPSSESPLIGDGEDWNQFSEDSMAPGSNHHLSSICSTCGQSSCDGRDCCRSWGDSSVPFMPQVMKPCRYFADSSCAKGDSCPFIHDIRMQKAVYTMPDTVGDGELKRASCRYYSQGFCQRGNDCHFRHDSDENYVENPKPLSPIPRSEHSWGERTTNWLLNTDDDAPKWGDELPSAEAHLNDGGTGSGWFQDMEENTDWVVDQQLEGKWNSVSAASETVDESNGSNWVQETDINSAWGVAHQPASSWIADTPSVADQHVPDAMPDIDNSSLPVEDDGAQQSWGLPWPDAIPDAKPTKKKGFCMYFGQGHCYNGDQCAFRHVRREPAQDYDREPAQKDNTDPQQNDPDCLPHAPDRLPEIVQDLPTRSVFNSMVKFGSGGSPEQVVTPFESPRLILSDYPSGISHADLLHLVEPYGAVKNSIFQLSVDGVQAHVEFEDHAQAANASLNLNGFSVEQTIIRANLDSVASVGGGHQEHLGVIRGLKLVWDVPSVSAWAFYENVGVAKNEGVRLNGSTYGSRKIFAEYRKPSQKHSIPVFLNLLPPRVKRDELHAFCVGASSVSLNTPTYLQSPDDSILAYLKGFGPVNHFEVLPTDPSEQEITGFVEFFMQDAALNAARALKGTQHDFLGKGRISVQQVFHSKYDCANCPFAIIRNQLTALRDAFSASCTIRWYDQAPCIHIYGREAKAVALVAKSVQALIFGADLGCWDPYFETPSSEEAMRHINSNNDASFHVRTDKRRRVLQLWGDRDKAEKQITRLLKRVKAQRHSLCLDARLVSALLNGGLQSLHDAFGASKVILDLRAESLTVLGDIKDEVEGRLDGLASAHVRGTGNCCLCSSDVVQPVIELTCNHVYCSPCLQLLLRPIPGVDFFPVRCIAKVGDSTESCLATIPTHVLLSQLPVEEQTEFLEAAVLSYTRSKSQYCFCNFGCPVLYRRGLSGQVFTCPQCHHELCASCTVPVHAGLTCEENATLQESSDWTAVCSLDLSTVA